MRVGRHRRSRFPAPRAPIRHAMLAVCLWSFVASLADGGSRYERIVKALLASVVIVAIVVPSERRVLARKAVTGLTTPLFAVAGVVASISIDEGMTLLAGGVLAAVLSLLLGSDRVQPRHLA